MRTSRPSAATARAASSALCIVADSAPDSVTTTMPVGASVGEAAVGLLELAGRRGRGRGQLAASRAAGPELGRASARSRSTNSSSPKRMVSGTISMPSCVGEVVGQVAGAVGDDADRSCWLGGRGESVTGPGRYRRRLVGRRGRRSASAASGETATSASPVGLVDLADERPGGRRRRRRKWLYHHDSSTSTAPPVITWPRPVRALTRAVEHDRRARSAGRTPASAAATSIDDVPLARASTGITTSVTPSAASVDELVAVGERQLRRARAGRRPAAVVVGVLRRLRRRSGSSGR